VKKVEEFLWNYAPRATRDAAWVRAMCVSDRFSNVKLKMFVLKVLVKWGIFFDLGLYWVKSKIRRTYYGCKWQLIRLWKSVAYFVNSRPQYIRLFLAVYRDRVMRKRSFKENLADTIKFYTKYCSYGMWNLRDYNDHLDYEYRVEQQAEARIDWGPDMYR
jgi:hypothetical protein